MNKTLTQAKKITLCGVMVALALALSYIERFIPLQMVVPLPGVKLGLANTVTLVALYMMKTRYAFLILVTRCLMGAIFSGSATGLLFSMCGGLLAMSMMALTKRMTCISIYGVSILGAAFHNIGQIFVAIFMMGSVYVIGYLPYLLLVSVFTGMATGSICAGVFRILKTNTQIIQN